MIRSGDLAAMSGSDLKVYLVVKSYSNFSTGRAFPAIETICEGTGLSNSQVIRCLKSLEKHGYMTKEKRGRRNYYTLREKVECIDEDGKPAAVATWDYLPSTVKDARAELKRFLLTGEHDGSVIHIEHLTLNVFQDQAIQINMTDALKNMPAETRKSIEALMKRYEGKKRDEKKG